MKKIFASIAILGMLSVAGVASAAPFNPVPKPTCFISVSPLYKTGLNKQAVLTTWTSALATSATFKVGNAGPANLLNSTKAIGTAVVIVNTTKTTTFTLKGTNAAGSTTCSKVLAPLVP